MSPSQARPCADVAHRVEDELRAVLGILKLESAFPPTSAASALARAAGQIVTLSAIYDGAADSRGDGAVALGDWCGRFVAALAQGLGKDGSFSFAAPEEGPRVALAKAESIGLLLGELLADASERAWGAGRDARVEVELDGHAPSGILLRVKDGAPPAALPPVARLLAAELGAELRDSGGIARAERELLFETAGP